jgi:hypothetical protein
MSDLTHKGVLSPRNGAISQFVLDRFDYGELDLCETMFPELSGAICSEKYGENWLERAVFEDEGGY